MIKIEIEDGRANLFTPYNPDFVKKIKGIGGAKWNASEKCWGIPEAAVDAAREIMQEVYGYSDISENETVSVKVTIEDRMSECCGDVFLFGKVLAHASGRDSGARVGDDVAYISGGADSGGSVKNWKSVVEAGSVVILSNVNKSVFERSEIPEGVKVEVLAGKASKSQLLDEKERLLKRIAEIDKLLLETD